MKAKVLIVGDIFLGRRPASLPRILTDRGLEPAELGPAAAWRNVVTWAIQNQVQGVVLAGGTVESPEDRFEAFDDLETGVVRLLEAGIPVCGVAGSRDTVVLPLLAERHKSFQLLGSGGEWSWTEIELDQKDKVRILGWSHPSLEAEGDPLDSLPKLPDDKVPTIGVLSASFGGEGLDGGVAVSEKALSGTTAHAWVIGSGGNPDELSAPRPVGNVGAILGFGPGDSGPRGPWLLTVHGPGQIEADHVPLSPVRWEDMEIDAKGLERFEGEKLGEELKNRVLGALREVRKRAASDLGEALAVPCQLRFTGTCRNHLRLREIVATGDLQALFEESQGAAFFVHRIVDQCSPDLDFEALSRDKGMAGILARRLEQLMQNDPKVEEFLQAANDAVQPVVDGPLWSGLEPEPDAVDVRACLIQAGTLALEELLDQKTAHDAEAKR